MRFQLLALMASVFLLGACGEPVNSFTDTGRRTDATADSSACGPGQWYCIGDTARQCAGGAGMQDCQAMGLTCVQTLGCAVCAPGSNRCSPDDPQQTQRCNANGSGWSNGVTCDPANGLQCNGGLCEDRCNPTTLSYLGCEYWPTITPNSQLDPEFSFAVSLANPQTYQVRVRITGGTLRSPIDRTLMPLEVATVELPWNEELGQNRAVCFDTIGRPPPIDCIARSGSVTGGAFHVQANGPIAAYQFNPLRYRTASGVFSFTNDASLLLPTRVLTNHYIVVAHENWSARDATGTLIATLGGFVSIVGVDNNETGTRVTVRLTAAIRDPANRTVIIPPGMRTFTVRQGDVLTLVGSNPDQDITGSIIDSDHPVAVFTGHDCTNIPVGRPACDHMEEQLFPNETWGRRYAVTQPRDRGTTEAHIVRIMSQRAGNTLSFDGIPTPPACANVLAAGQFCEFETRASFQVSGTQPLLVMQFMTGLGTDSACVPRPGQPPPDRPECVGDPAMVTEVPIDQFRRSYDFFVPSTYTSNFVNVVAPTGTMVRLDNMVIPTGNQATAGAGFTVFFVAIAPGAHHIEAVAESDRIGIKVYGVASYTSYMYPGGLDLAQISPPG